MTLSRRHLLKASALLPFVPSLPRAPSTPVGHPPNPVLPFPPRIVGGGLDAGIGRQYDVAPDGRFLINTELPGEAAPITLIQNWQPGN